MQTNNIMASYHDFGNDNDSCKKAQFEICAENSDLKIIDIIFSGNIYDSNNKIATQIFRVKHNNKNCVLKIQYLKTDVNEYDIRSEFTKHNHSSIFRLYDIYKYTPYNLDKGYGYIISELLPNPRYMKSIELGSNGYIYYGIADIYQMQQWCNAHISLHRDCLNGFSIDQTISVWDFYQNRISNRQKVNIDKGYIDRHNIYARYTDFMNTQRGYIQSQMSMVYTHGHLTNRDMLRIDGGDKYTIFSLLFLGIRPCAYSLVFHIYNTLLYDMPQDFDDYIGYCRSRQDVYIVYEDQFDIKNLEYAFAINMLERCLGVLYLDLHILGRYTDSDINKRIKLYEYYEKQISKLN